MQTSQPVLGRVAEYEEATQGRSLPELQNDMSISFSHIRTAVASENSG